MKVASVFAAASLCGLLAAEEPSNTACYTIDAAGSTIGWELPATLHTVHGTVPEFSGSVDLTSYGSESAMARARVTVRAAAMKTGNESRDKAMREKVLETTQYPEIVFELDQVEGDLGKVASRAPFDAKVAGRLTVHGKTLPLQATVSVAPAADSVTISGSFPLQWKSYGLHDPSFGVVTVREPMKVTFRLRAVPEASGPK